MIQGPRSASDWTPEVARLPISEPMYVLRATPEICVIFQTSDRAIEVLDVVLTDTLDSFSRTANNPDHRAQPKKGSTSSNRTAAKVVERQETVARKTRKV